MITYKKTLILSFICIIFLLIVSMQPSNASDCDLYIKKLKNSSPQQVFGNKIAAYNQFNDGGSESIELTDGTTIYIDNGMFSPTYGKITCTPPNKEYQQPNCDTYIKEILNTKNDISYIKAAFHGQIKYPLDENGVSNSIDLTLYNGTKISVDKNNGKVTCTQHNSSTPIVAYPNCDIYTQKLQKTIKEKINYLIAKNIEEVAETILQDKIESNEISPNLNSLILLDGTKISIDKENNGKITCTPPENSNSEHNSNCAIYIKKIQEKADINNIKNNILCFYIRLVAHDAFGTMEENTQCIDKYVMEIFLKDGTKISVNIKNDNEITCTPPK